MTKRAWTIITTLVFGSLILSGGATVAAALDATALKAFPAHAQAAPSPATVWDGVYTQKQADRGAQAYKKACGSCHGEDLKGDAKAPALVGEAFFDRWSGLTIHDVFFAIQITMSHSYDMFPPSQTVADIVSYVFSANKIPAGKSDLPIDQDLLRMIAITKNPTTP